MAALMVNLLSLEHPKRRSPASIKAPFPGFIEPALATSIDPLQRQRLRS
jgi:hypothetical protein